MLRKLLVAVVCIVPVIRTCLVFLTPINFVTRFVLMLCRADALVLGVPAAVVIRTPASREWMEKRAKLLIGVMLTLAAGCLLSISRASGDSPLVQSVGYT